MCSNLPLISLSIRFQCCPSSHAPSFHRCAWLLPARAVTRCSSTRFARALALEKGDGDTGANGCECPRGHKHDVSLATARGREPQHTACVTPCNRDSTARRSTPGRGPASASLIVCARACGSCATLRGCHSLAVLLFLVCQSFSSPHLMCSFAEQFLPRAHHNHTQLVAIWPRAPLTRTRVARPSAA